MNQILKVNQTVQTATSGMPVEVERFLGGGGQGEVYRAMLAGGPVALKWYLPSAATPEQRAALDQLTKLPQPSAKFLWPMEVAVASGVPDFGYVMPLRDDRYKGIVDLMKRRIEPTFGALATAGYQLSDSFFQLHAKGLCYRDISFGNVFFDPETGDVLICDNDNVTVDGGTKGGVVGTPRFMAPEVVRGETKPSTQTDLFSLAVLLFYMFMVHHPLEGRKETAIRCMDLPAMTKLYGTAPHFIFDPDDDSNAPDPAYHANALAYWPVYPQFLRDLFTRSFTEGIRDPGHGRVRESEWRKAMIRLRDSIVYCPSCGMENFYDLDAMKASGRHAGTCWSCGREVTPPARLRVGRQIVMLNHDSKLYPHHIDDTRIYDFGAPVAEVSRHPTDPNIWGLKNLSGTTWTTILADGTMREVAPGNSVRIAIGTKVQFGTTEGEFRM